MSGPDKDRVLELVEEAQRLARSDRTRFVRESCGADDALRAEVEELLSFDDDDDSADTLEAISGGAARFIDSFKEQIKDATRRAEAQLTHEALFDELMTGLRQHGVTAHRYRLGRELGRGGMGEVLEAWDLDLRRRVALKRIRRVVGDGSRPGTLPVGAGMQIRFLQEAQITAQLDHPGVLPIHELGVDEDGRLFFTMPLIEGESLSDVLRAHGPEAPAWRERRVMDALLHVAQAIAHAHERGVVHRDLKPSNVMVGRHGAVHLMDWGIARVIDDDRAHELFFGIDADPALAAELQSTAIDAAFETVAGSAVGTPSYMPPEQAAGDHDALGPAADVYSLGAILYELLTGCPPYTNEPGADSERPSAHEVLERVQAGPPTPLAQLAPDAPPELVAICERAMQRRAKRRFASAQSFVSDLTAYLDGRVVESYEQGVWPELRKWIGRNRTLAATIALALVSVIAGIAGVLTLQARREADAQKAAADLQDQVHDFERLTAMQDAERLERTALDLWPVSSDMLTPLRAWRAEALELLGTLPEFEDELATLRREKGIRRSAETRAQLTLQHPLNKELRRKTETRRLLTARADELRANLADAVDSELDEGRRAEVAATLAEVERELRELPPTIAELAEEIRIDVELDFEDPHDGWWERQLRNYVATMKGLGHPLTGPLRGLSREYGPGVEWRIQAALRMQERESDLAVRADWQVALDDLAHHPAFEGWPIAPMFDLVPLRRDPRSGLWEFLHAPSGEAPELDPNSDTWRIEACTGVIVVLVPGGESLIGAQDLDEDQPHYCRFAREREYPGPPVSLDPYYLAKYELTQAQFVRLGGWNPSIHQDPDGVHPLENATWEQSVAVLTRFDLTLPTEAQWETAARAGTTTSFWCGEHTLDVIGFEVMNFNRVGGRGELREAYLAMFGDRNWPKYSTTMPVDVLYPNPWGFYQMLGNVDEWCLDLSDEYDAPTAPRTGERVAVRDGRNLRVFRGGCFERIPVNGRASRREARPQNQHVKSRGVRPVRLAALAE